MLPQPWASPSTAARVARGAAYGDINNDGAPDVVITTNAGPLRSSSIRVQRITPCASSSSAQSRIATASAQKSRSNLPPHAKANAPRSGSSYLSSSELVLTFGLGSSTKADAIEVRWPSGTVDHLNNVNADQISPSAKAPASPRPRPRKNAAERRRDEERDSATDFRMRARTFSCGESAFVTGHELSVVPLAAEKRRALAPEALTVALSASPSAASISRYSHTSVTINPNGAVPLHILRSGPQPHRFR